MVKERLQRRPELPPDHDEKRIARNVDALRRASSQDDQNPYIGRQDVWVAESVSPARYGVEVACEVMGLNRFDFDILSGVQGAGKGTNLRAISEAAEQFMQSDTFKEASEDLKAFVTGRVNGTANIVTGTGGIFVPPPADNEYRRMFGGLNVTEMFVGHGLLVPDDLTSLQVHQMLQKRIYEGFGSAQIDLWPRTAGQYEEMLELQKRLNDSGVSTPTRMMDLRLIPADRIAHMNEHRTEYAETSKTFGTHLDKLLKSEESRIKEMKPEDQLVYIRGVLKGMQIATNDEIYNDLVNEALEAFTRMEVRSKKEGRMDDVPLAILKRIKSFSKDTAPGFLQIDGVKIVSALQTPEDVARDLVIALVGDDELEGEAGEEFIRLVQERANEIVNGKKDAKEPEEGLPPPSV